MLGLKLCSGYSFSSIEGVLGLDIRGGYSICSIYGVYRGWKFAVVTAFAVLTCTRHCSWTSMVVTEFVVFMGRWGWTLSVLTGYVAFMECWCRTFAVVTEFVAFIELWGWTFVVVTALVVFYEVLGLDVCGGYSIWSIYIWGIGVGCLWCLKNLQDL